MFGLLPYLNIKIDLKQKNTFLMQYKSNSLVSQ